MFLITAATAFELEPFVARMGELGNCSTLVTGVGLVETAVNLALYLGQQHQQVQSLQAVINIGIAGAFIKKNNQAQMLDICLAEQEVLGDFGICFGERMEPFAQGGFAGPNRFLLDASLIERAEQILAREQIVCKRGVFVTVNGVSATLERGDHFVHLYDGCCENMEGAAVARVCQAFGVPMLEIRCISNMVEVRDKKKWQIQPALQRCGEVAAKVVKELAGGK
ncbi:MAG: futalosine hydrolase [Desulfobacterales bacterium]|nr:MAG: futalosine hydrolase [Desulfobacterales bacterium]